MGEIKVTGSALTKTARPQKLEDQLLDILNNSKLSDQAKLTAIDNAIAKLSAPQRQALYERLKVNNPSDALSRQVRNLAGADDVLRALNPSHDKAAAQDSPGAADAAATATKKAAEREVTLTAAALKEAKALMSRGNQLLKEHKYDAAIATFQEGFRTYPDPKFILNEASALFDAGRYSEALLTYERYLSDPNAPRADEVRVMMDRARTALGGLESTMSNVVEARRFFEEGAKAFQEGRYEEALEAFTNAYEKDPIADFEYNQGSALEKLGRPYAAAARYESYLNSKPGANDAVKIRAQIKKLRHEADSKPITAGGRAGGEEWMARGNQLLQARRYKEAIAAYQEGFRTYPNSGFILNEASALKDSGRYAEAVLAYERYLSDPEAPRADEARAAMESAKAAMGGSEATITGVEESRTQFEKGGIAFQEGRYQEALEAFQKAHELNPLAEFKFNQASALEELGRPYAAANQLDAYLAAKPNAKDASQIRAKINKLRTQADKAPITATGEAGGQEWMARGNRLLFAHRYDEAVAAFREGFRTYPSSAFILNEASALLDGGRYAEADRAYERYLSDPDAPRAGDAREAQKRARAHLSGPVANAADVTEAQRLLDLGVKEFKAGRYDEALAAFERAYERNPQPEFKYNQAACLEKLGRRYAAAERYGQYAAGRPDAKDAARVKQHIEKVLNEADKAPITASGQAGGYEWLVRGNRMLHARRYDEAVLAFEEGFRTYPDNTFILNKASSLLDAGRYAEADLAYGRYLSDPNAPRADDARAAQLRARSHMGGREATITGIAESGRLFEQANKLYEAGRYHEALQAYDRAYTLNPRAEIRYNQGACLSKLGKRELAAQRFEEYLKEKPGAPDTAKVQKFIEKLRADALKGAREAFDRGQADFTAGRYKEAAAGFAEAYEQRPFPQFLYNIGASYDKAGDVPRAVQNYQRYLSMYPDAADADKVRRQIHTLLKTTGNELMQP